MSLGINVKPNVRNYAVEPTVQQIQIIINCKHKSTMLDKIVTIPITQNFIGNHNATNPKISPALYITSKTANNTFEHFFKTISEFVIYNCRTVQKSLNIAKNVILVLARSNKVLKVSADIKIVRKSELNQSSDSLLFK